MSSPSPDIISSCPLPTHDTRLPSNLDPTFFAAVLPFVKEALGRLAEGLEAFRTVSSGLNDPIRIVATHTAAITTLPEWLRRCGLSLEKNQILLNSFRTERCFQNCGLGAPIWRSACGQSQSRYLKIFKALFLKTTN